MKVDETTLKNLAAKHELCLLVQEIVKHYFNFNELIEESIHQLYIALLFLAQLSRRLRCERIGKQSSRRLSVCVSVSSHFRTSISLRPVGGSQSNFI